ncbi:MAG: O-antigen ligase family protein [Patescibacteria group bacterium]|nr:MAG: O-antigen ligase family protein [Patescibacteria group bacterium]
MKKEVLIKISSLVVDWGLRLSVFLVPIYFAWFKENYGVFDLNKVFLLGFLSVFILSAWFLNLSLTRSWSRVRQTRVFLPFSLVILSWGLATLVAINSEMALWGSYGRKQGLYALLNYALIFFIAVNWLKDRRSFEKILAWWLAGVFLSCYYGLIQLAGLDPYNWLVVSNYRIFSGYGQTNFFAHYLVVSIPLTVYFIFQVAKKRLIIFALWSLLAMEFTCLLFTYSRGAWLALLAAGFTAFLFWLIRKKYFKTLTTILVLSACSIFLLFFTPLRSLVTSFTDTEEHSFFVVRISSILDFKNDTIKARLQYWEPTLPTFFKETPLRNQLFGYGPDNQEFFYSRLYQADWAYFEAINSFPDRAHLVFFDILLHFGILGLLAFTWFSFLIIKRLFLFILRSPEQGNYFLALTVFVSLVAYFVNNLFSFSTTAMSLLWFILMAIAWLIPDNYRLTIKPIKSFSSISLYFITFFVFLTTFFVWYMHGLSAYVADHYLYEAKKLGHKAPCAQVLPKINKMLDWYFVEPLYRENYLSYYSRCLSSIDKQEDRLLVASLMDEVFDSLKKNYQLYNHNLSIALSYTTLGEYLDKKYYEEAEEIYFDLINLNPWLTSTYQDFGIMRIKQQRFEEAIDIFQEGLNRSPDSYKYDTIRRELIKRSLANFHELIGSVYFMKNELGLSLESYQKAVELNPKLATAYKKIADIAYARGEFEEAIRLTYLGYSQFPNDYTWSYALAILYHEKKDTEKALEYSYKALSLSPENEQVKELLEIIENQ